MVAYFCFNLKWMVVNKWISKKLISDFDAIICVQRLFLIKWL